MFIKHKYTLMSCNYLNFTLKQNLYKYILTKLKVQCIYEIKIAPRI